MSKPLGANATGSGQQPSTSVSHENKFFRSRGGNRIHPSPGSYTKRAPLAKIRSSSSLNSVVEAKIDTKIQTSKDTNGCKSCTSDEESIGLGVEEDELNSDLDDEVPLRNLLQQLGSKVDSKIRLKKQKLDREFEEALALPGKIAKFLQEHDKRREAIIGEFQGSFQGLNEKLANMLKLQKQLSDSCTKHQSEMSSSHEDLKRSLNDCKSRQKGLFTSFFKEEKKSNQKMEEGLEQYMEQNNKETSKLQKRLNVDMYKQEVQAVSNLQHFVSS